MARATSLDVSTDGWWLDTILHVVIPTVRIEKWIFICDDFSSRIFEKSSFLKMMRRKHVAPKTQRSNLRGETREPYARIGDEGGARQSRASVNYTKQGKLQLATIWAWNDKLYSCRDQYCKLSIAIVQMKRKGKQYWPLYPRQWAALVCWQSGWRQSSDTPTSKTRADLGQDTIQSLQDDLYPMAYSG